MNLPEDWPTQEMSEKEALAAAPTSPAQEIVKTGPKIEFVEALKIAERVFEQYKLDHPKWWKRMDGTPILNDVAVRMAVAYQESMVFNVETNLPSAQENEPVAWINQTANPYAPLDMHFQFQDPHDAKWTPLYTRPDDKLRKLAEEYIEYMCPGADVDRSSAQIFAFLYTYEKKIRAALEK